MKELLYRKIYLQLKADILDGRLSVDERLPGVREISEEWSTSANTVLRALSELEVDGLIRKTRGRGIFVQDRHNWHSNSIGNKELGVILCDMNEPFNLRLLGSVEKAAKARGYRLSVGRTEKALSSAVAGVIAVPSSPSSFDSLQSDLPDVPVIFTGKFSPAQNFEGHYVIADVYSGFFHAASLLLESGRQRLAYIGGGDVSTGDPGSRAVRDVLNGTRLGFRGEYAVSAGGYDSDHGRIAMENLLLNEEYPDAVFCSSDSLAAGAYKACRAAGLSIPSDISIVGSGDQDIAPLLEPPLTTLRVPAELLGTMAAGFLVELLNGGISDSERVRSRLDPQLVVRGSALYDEAEEVSPSQLIGADGVIEGITDSSKWL